MKKAPLFLLTIVLCNFNFTHAQKLDKFESTIVEFEIKDKENDFHSEAILFTGSSSIKMWKTLEQDMAPMQVINRGFGGSTLP